jgi:hypothetical protein
MVGGTATLLVVLFLALFPSVGVAGCGGPVTAYPKHHPRGQRPPLAIGDSTMLLSVPGLAAGGYSVYAHGCLQFSQGLALMRQLKAQNRLPHMVALALGANGYVTRADIGAALGVMCCNGLLVLVTPRQLGGSAGANAANERQAAHRHPGRILLLDWVSFSAGHSAWFQPDGLHLTWPGVHAFTRLLSTALRYAYPKPETHRHHHRGRPRHKPTPRH